MRVREALNARDVAVARLSDACVSTKENNNVINTLREERDRLQKQLDASVTSSVKEGAQDKENFQSADPADGLAAAIKIVEERLSALKVSDGHSLDVEGRAKVSE